MSPEQLQVRRVLDRLELAETRRLAWGLVEGGFSESEVLREVGEEPGPLTTPELFSELLAQRLVFKDPVTQLYRTRMSEGIRLMRFNRQWFPPRKGGEPDWRSGRPLVSDFRLSVVPRRYPRRDISAEALITSLAASGVDSGLYGQPLRAMLSRGPGFGLARFQAESTRQILSDLSGDSTRGVVVGAGTGTGKTLAFYLPVLAHIAMNKRERSTHVLAVYPRNELLKDQFAQAYEDARRLDALLQGRGLGPVSIGVFNGLTPDSNETLAQGRANGWREHRAGHGVAGFTCPYMGCPKERCDGRLMWPLEDVKRNYPRLVCQVCGYRVEGHLQLTREQLARCGPDILFTSFDMLNRALTDLRARVGVFGIGQQRPPRIVLLDEVHTYEGSLGAHAALVLRRWRWAIGRWNPVQFVGLSATLRNAHTFFADLTSLAPGMVSAIEPLAADLQDPEGMEYRLALRGDPFSGAELRSTTIQTAMLLRRLLEPKDFARPLYGRQVFVFSDTLDGVNRLFVQLNDAERNGLAGLRARGQPKLADRRRNAQSWEAVEDIGHSMPVPQPVPPPANVQPPGALRVRRTTSQFQGVDAGADVIIATSSLEVGYDSPAVGAVIQHKAPRGAASFLQRIGRAGRHPSMRPWKVCILSDYGRDRLVYQSYDMLFDPQLPPRWLPVSNQSVLRIQAAFAFMDWMARKLRPAEKGSVWADFAQPWVDPGVTTPTAGPTAVYGLAFERQQREAELIERVLCGTLREDLAEYIRSSLQLDAHQLRAVLWSPPRGLLTCVLPTILRRLRTAWRRAAPEAGGELYEYFEPDRPMPEFLPDQLACDLNLPEVGILAPVFDHLQMEEPMGVVQALNHLAPGNVSRRFAPYGVHAAHWVDPQAAVDAPLGVRDFVSHGEVLGEVQFNGGHGTETVRCVRPWQMKLKSVPYEVKHSSRGQLLWKHQIGPTAPTEAMTPPTTSRWRRSVASLRFFTHAQGNPAKVRRFATSAEGAVNLRDGRVVRWKKRFASVDGLPIAIGFDLESDALAVALRIPPDLACLVDGVPALVQGLRPAFFRWLIAHDETLQPLTTSFQRDRLSDVFLAAIAGWATLKNGSLLQALEGIQKEGTSKVLLKALQAFFQSRAPQAEDNETDFDQDDVPDPDTDDDGGGDLPFGIDQLRELLERHPEIPCVLEGAASGLWGSFTGTNDSKWEHFLRDSYAATLAEAVVQACAFTCPQYSIEDLIVDVGGGVPIEGLSHLPMEDEGPLTYIWLSERQPGGSGIIEALLTSYSDDPGRFFSMLESSLRPSDFEVADAQLTRAVALACDDAQVQQVFNGAREARGHVAAMNSFRGACDALRARGVTITQPIAGALSTRLLRPGSPPGLDPVLRSLIALRNQLEERLGIELDARVFSFVAAGLQPVEELLKEIAQGDPAVEQSSWRLSQIYSLLWPRGSGIRTATVSSYNPFGSPAPRDRLLVLVGADCDLPIIDVTGAGWKESAQRSLVQVGQVQLRTRQEEAAALRDAIALLVAAPVESGFLGLYPAVVGVEVEGGMVNATLRIREFLV